MLDESQEIMSMTMGRPLLEKLCDYKQRVKKIEHKTYF